MKNVNDNFNLSGLRISKTTLPNPILEDDISVKIRNDDEFLKVLHHNCQEIMIVINSDGKVKYCNQALKTHLNYEPFRILEKNIQQIIPIQLWVSFRAAMRACEEESNQNVQIDCQFLNQENKPLDFSLSFKDQRHHPQVGGYVVYAQKITRLKKQEKKLKMRNLVMEILKESIVVVSAGKPSIVYANDAFLKLSGFTKAEIFGKRLNIFKAPYSDMLFAEPTSINEIRKFHSAIIRKTPYFGRVYSKKKNGKIFYNRLHVKPVLDSNGEVENYIVSMLSIKKRKSQLA